MAQTVRSIRPYTDRVSEPEKIAPPRSEQKANIQRTPSDAKRPSAASGRKPQIAGIEPLRVLQGSDEQHRVRVQVAPGLLLSMQSNSPTSGSTSPAQYPLLAAPRSSATCGWGSTSRLSPGPERSARARPQKATLPHRHAERSVRPAERLRTDSDRQKTRWRRPGPRCEYRSPGRSCVR